MPLYELVYFVSSKASLPTVAQVMKRNAEVVFENKGVIRRLDNMGILSLNYPMYRHREKHYKARWITMLFDGSPTCLQQLNTQISKDQQVFRWAFYKQQDTFRQTYDEQIIHEDQFEGEDMLLKPQLSQRKENKNIIRQVLQKNDVNSDDILIQTALNDESENK